MTTNKYMIYDYETETVSIVFLQDFNNLELFPEEIKEITSLVIGTSFLVTALGQKIAVITRVK